MFNDFHRLLRTESYRKYKLKIITVQKKVKVWFHISVATLQAHKSENGLKTNCYNYKRNTIELLLKWFLTTRMATTPYISICRLSLLNIRAFFQMFPNVCFPIYRRWKNISKNSLHNCKLQPQENLSLKYEQDRTKLKFWKIVANEKYIAEYGELSSVKNFVWANHGSKNAQNNP